MYPTQDSTGSYTHLGRAGRAWYLLKPPPKQWPLPMIRSVLVRGLFVAVGAAVASLVISWRTPLAPAPYDGGPVSAPLAPGRALGASGGAENLRQADIERRLKRLEASVAEAAAEHHRLEEQLAAMASRLAAREPAAEQAAAALPSAGSAPAAL